ncbi:MAG: OsmC family protein [Candidatus Marinimicrobia bacterium]|nr:OsmC family protein [Candidatus Neomarinimicrobiota bacterium]MDD5583057.1 OsmC family protein [Candidatus Neomarinimicrobiota bacterium]
MKVTLKGIGDHLTFMAKGDSGHWVPIDADESLNGFNAGSRPMELVLEALAGCTAMDVLSILHKKHMTYDRFAIDIEAERAKEHPKVFTNIHVIYKFWGDNLLESAIQRAIELSETKYCSVNAMLRKSAKITSEYRLNEKE